MLEVRLLGIGRVHYLEEPLHGFPDQLPYRVLCYLVLNRHQSQPRSPPCCLGVTQRALELPCGNTWSLLCATVSVKTGQTLDSGAAHSA